MGNIILTHELVGDFIFTNVLVGGITFANVLAVALVACACEALLPLSDYCDILLRLRGYRGGCVFLPDLSDSIRDGLLLPDLLSRFCGDCVGEVLLPDYC